MYDSKSYIDSLNLAKPFNGWTFTDKIETYSFEEVDPFYWESFGWKYRNLVYVGGALYVVTIFSLQRFMKNREAFELRMPLFWWNLSLGIFSLFAFIRMTPGTWLKLTKSGGFYESICLKSGDAPTLLWGILFALSKFVEFGDSIFVVLRKRPLVFLQYYHHVATAIGVGLIVVYNEPVARWFAYLNYGVHALMYNYFALRAVGVKIPGFIANIITTLQLAQMILAFSANVVSAYFYYGEGHDCYRHPDSIKISGFVHATFIILFGNLFYQLVIKKGRLDKEKMKKLKLM